MIKTTDNYSAFNEINLSNARSENESYEDYKKRMKQNKQIINLYFTVGRDNFKEMFPNGVEEALKNSEEQQKEIGTEDKTVHNS
jgi:hypothetical protein